jgi:hypothetical protein
MPWTAGDEVYGADKPAVNYCAGLGSGEPRGTQARAGDGTAALRMKRLRLRLSGR